MGLSIHDDTTTDEMNPNCIALLQFFKCFAKHELCSTNKHAMFHVLSLPSSPQNQPIVLQDHDLNTLLSFADKVSYIISLKVLF